MEPSSQSGLGETMEDPSGRCRSAERDDAALYIADMVENLAAIARRHHLDTLGYLLDIARMEAEGAARGRRDMPLDQ